MAERLAGGADRLVRLLRVLRLLRVEPGAVGEELVAVALGDQPAGRLQRGVGQRRAVGPHVGDEALLVEPLGRPHRHLRGETELAAGLLLERRGDEGRRRAPPVRLRLTGSDLVRHSLEVAGQGGGTGLVEHDHVVARQPTVVAEVAAAGETDSVDLGERCGERRGGGPVGGELALDVPVAGRHEGHPLAFAFDDEAGAHALDPTGRQRRHDLLPQHGRDLVAVEAVEDAARLLRVDHLAVELAGFIDGRLDRLLGDLVEDHSLHGDLRVEDLDEVPGDRLALTILIRREIELVGVLQQRLQETDVVLLVGVLHVERLEPVVDVDPRAGPLLTLVGLGHVGGVARKVADVTDGRFHGVSGAEVLGDLLGFRRGLDDDEGVGHGGEPNRSWWGLSILG